MLRGGSGRPVSDFEHILLDLPGPDDHGIATLTLNRPEAMNAFTNVMVREMVAAFDITDADDTVRSVIVTGAGRAFCAGADLSGGADTFNASRQPDRVAGDNTTRVPRDGGGRVTTRIFESRKPVIGAINGHAVGVGITMTLPMDIRMASTGAKIGFVFAKRGIVPEAASSWFLPRLVGISNALDLLYSARLVDAAEAQSMNLVSRVMPPETLRESTIQYAQELATQVSPRSLRMMKRELYQAQFQSLSEAIDQANQDMLESFSCNDFREGVAHFIEKRPPRFTGT